MSCMTWVAKARVPLAMLLALTVCGGGCRSDKDGAADARPGEDFLRDDETSAVTRIADRQAAVGARTDATLRPYHFRRAGLNSLGREKLDQILAADEGADQDHVEVVVYVDVDGDEANRQHADARRAAVSDYLASRGLADGDVRLESGPNPYNTMSAASAAPKEKDAQGGEDGAAAAELLRAVTEMAP
jgi:hypothetical protein